MPELPLTMPKMSMTMEEGTMVSWLKTVGETVRAGEPICEVATDKVDMEVESPFDGVLARVVAEPDETIAVGETIAWITTDADDLLGGLFDEPAISEEERSPQAPESISAVAAAQDAVAPDWTPSVPAARALAESAGVDIASVAATGPGGAVTVPDVERAIAHAAPAAPAAPAASAVVAPVAAPVVAPVPAAPAATDVIAAPPPVADRPESPSPVGRASEPRAQADPVEARRRRTRVQVARVMTASAAVPQFAVSARLDLAVLSRARHDELGGASWTALLIRAHALALSTSPALRARWVDDGVEPDDHIGIAIAVDSPSGLLAPVVHDPHEGSLAELIDEIALVVEQARQGTLPVARLTGGTSVFSNLGGFGVDSFEALLTPPHATALAVGAVTPELVVHSDGSFAPRPLCRVALTVDHRVADGADAGRYISALRRLVADPSSLR